jgi:hypothetical protein
MPEVQYVHADGISTCRADDRLAGGHPRFAAVAEAELGQLGG